MFSKLFSKFYSVFGLVIIRMDIPIQTHFVIFEEMRTFFLTDYPNLFDHIKVSSESIENSVKNYPLEFLNVRDNQVEWEIKFPSFISTFYKYYYNHKILPTQVEFWENYLSNNKIFFNTLTLTPNQQLGLKARLYRTYPSLIRDIHFATLINEQFGVGSILYNTKLDIEEGIDLLIINSDKLWAINLYTKTRNAIYARSLKSERHKPFVNVNYVEFPMDFKGSKKCGSFFLYSDIELKELQKMIGY